MLESGPIKSTRAGPREGLTRAGLRGVRLDPRAVDAASLAAWSELADRAAEPNPFFRPEFVVANVIERDVAAEILVVMDGARWVACLPVVRRAVTVRLPMPTLSALTDEYSFSGTPLLDREALDAAADGLVELIRSDRRAAALTFGAFESSGPVGSALAAAAERAGTQLLEHSWFARGGWVRTATGHFPGPAFTAHDRRQLIRRVRQLGTALGGEVRVVDRSKEPEAWERFLAMEHASWKGEIGTAFASKAQDAAFFRRVCAGLSESGHFELFALEVGDHTVAMESQLVDGTSLFAFKIAYDQEYRRFAPGTTLKYRLIERLEDSAMDVGDSCAAPENAHMNRLWPDQRVMRTLILPTRAPAAGLVRPMLGMRSFGQWLRDRVVRRIRHVPRVVPVAILTVIAGQEP